MRKKIIVLVAIMAMLVTIFSGCESPFKKVDPVAGWADTLKNVTTLSADISVQTYIQESVMGYDYLSSLTTDIQTEIDMGNGIAHVTQTTNRDVAGISQLVDTTESYLTTISSEEGPRNYSYQHYVIADESVWGKFSSDVSVDQYRESFDLSPSYSEGERQLINKSDDEKGIYTLSWEVPGSILAKYLGFSLLNTDIDNYISKMYFKASGMCREDNGIIVPHSMRLETSDEYVVDVNGSELPIKGMIIEIRFKDFNSEMKLEVPQDALNSVTYKDVEEFFADKMPDTPFYNIEPETDTDNIPTESEDIDSTIEEKG